MGIRRNNRKKLYDFDEIIRKILTEEQIAEINKRIEARINKMSKRKKPHEILAPHKD